jgi:hypothetical protein
VRGSIISGFAICAMATAMLGPAPASAQSPFQSAPGPTPAVRASPPHSPPPRRVEPEEPDFNAPDTTAPAPPPPPKPLVVTIPYTVSGSQMPWQWKDGGLNSGFKFGGNDGAPPAAVDAAHFRFNPGDPLIVRYVAGKVTASTFWGNAYVDARGDFDNKGDDGWGLFGGMPSRYMSPYPIYLVELVGTFATATGVIVGRPFAIGDGPLALTVPAGATQLLLGVNDCVFSDNGGAFNVSITGLHPAYQGPAPSQLTPQ